MPDFKLGKLAAEHRLETPCLGNFMSMKAVAKAIPAKPLAWGWEYKVKDDAWGDMGNLDAGDCVVATAGHLILNWTANKEKPIAPTKEQCIRVYSALTGYDPATGINDLGLVEQDFLNYWRDTGIPCTDADGNEVLHKILGWASIDVHNVEQLNAATYIFEGIFMGIQCPQSAVDDQINWVEVKDSPIAGGHGIPRLGYGRAGGNVISWGKRIPHTNEFLIANLDEAYAVVSADALNVDGKSVSGFDQQELLDVMTTLSPG